MPKPGEGPGIKTREQGFYNLKFYIKLNDNSIALAKVIGDSDPGYGSTSKILAVTSTEAVDVSGFPSCGIATS